MKKNKRGAHAAEPSKTKQYHFILFLIILLVIGIYFMITYPKSNPKPEEDDILSVPTINYLTLSNSHIVENSSDLISKDFSIDESNGISKVKGTVENTSNDNPKKLNFIYTLYDNSNNVIYEFEISISNLEPNSSSSFSSVCAVDLSNVVNYSIKLVE